MDTTDWTLYEVKSSSSRHHVRTALGQVLDYRRFLAHISAVGVVLPERPVDDLIDLLRSLGVGLVVEEKGQFVVLVEAARATTVRGTE